VQYWRFDEERKIKDSNGRPIIDANGEPRTEKVRLEEEKTALYGVPRSVANRRWFPSGFKSGPERETAIDEDLSGQ
jgi:hypothetical protein